MGFHEGQVVQLPVSSHGDNIAFAPPDGFIAVLETLSAP